MSTSFSVRRIRLDGAHPDHSWQLPNGVTVIVGASGGGKTSIVHLINYALGVDAPLIDEITQNASGVVIDIKVADHNLQLTRGFHQNRNNVLVSDGDGPQIIHLAKRTSANHPLLGEMLLQRLGIPIVQVAKSRTGRSNNVTSISFADVFRHCYLDEDDVDRSTAGSDDPFLEPKRASTFELLYRIIDAQVAKLEVERLELQETRAEREQQIKAVESFVQDTGFTAGADAIDARLREIDEVQIALSQQLGEARVRADAAVRDLIELPNAIAETQRRLAAAHDELAGVGQELEGVQRVANQLQRDLQTVQEGVDAHSVLSTQPFLRCPRCEQRLDGRVHEPDRCVVCLQPDPVVDDELVPLAIQDQLTRQLAETRAVEARLATLHGSLQTEIESLSAQMTRQLEEHAAVAAQVTAPHLNAINEIKQQQGTLRGERIVLAQARSISTAVAEEQREIANIPTLVIELAEREKERRELLEPARERVEDLSEEFNLILHRLTLPWLDTAEVDGSTYLPVVNGRDLKGLSSAGMRTTTNIAYYLANLAMALRDSEILTPNFMMLDSIRKASGVEREDLARAEHIYGYLRALQDSRNIPGALGVDFQLIVVDNDLPGDFARYFNVIRIDPDHPLIRNHG